MLVDASQIWEHAEAAAAMDSTMCWRMQRELYGHGKATRAWQDLFGKVLEETIELVRSKKAHLIFLAVPTVVTELPMDDLCVSGPYDVLKKLKDDASARLCVKYAMIF